MIMEDVADIAGYYDDATRYNDSREPKTLGQILDEDFEYRRWPVRNREERMPIDSRKRAIIHQRDGGICRHCGENPDGMLVLDHIIPRSAFPAHQLHIADRSDNLLSSCWDCNARRSNYECGWRKRLGVTVQCFYCVYPQFDYEKNEECEPLPYEVNVLTYCGSCGISRVPRVDGWIL